MGEMFAGQRVDKVKNLINAEDLKARASGYGEQQNPFTVQMGILNALLALIPDELYEAVEQTKTHTQDYLDSVQRAIRAELKADS